MKRKKRTKKWKFMMKSPLTTNPKTAGKKKNNSKVLSI
jgi:hypothetical protein